MSEKAKKTMEALEAVAEFMSEEKLEYLAGYAEGHKDGMARASCEETVTEEGDQ